MTTADLTFMILVVLIINFAFYLRLRDIEKRMGKFDEWADTVDDFMDSEYIELEFRVNDKEEKK